MSRLNHFFDSLRAASEGWKDKGYSFEIEAPLITPHGLKYHGRNVVEVNCVFTEPDFYTELKAYLDNVNNTFIGVEARVSNTGLSSSRNSYVDETIYLWSEAHIFVLIVERD